MTPVAMTAGPIRKKIITLHHGQAKVMRSLARFILALAGRQAGKTATGPHWLYREIRSKGPGDYLIASPNYPIMLKKALPAFLRLFKRDLKLGSYVGGDKKVFTFTDDGAQRTFGYVPDVATQVFFGHASNPDSLESATYKAAWLDECGQNGFKFGSWEAILGRLAIHLGRVLMTTTPYNLGWLYKQVYQRWERREAGYDVIRFNSKDNPAFPLEEYERAQRTMPRYRFQMFYMGMFTRPAGLIYDCFSDEEHTCPPFAIPAGWRRHLGLDFGGINTAAVFIAEDPGNKLLYLHREYWPRVTRTAKDHATALLKDEPGVPSAYGGSKSEGQWRAEFAKCGLPMREPPVADVEVGIDRVYALIKSGRLRIFSTCVHTIDELQSYSREVDDEGEALPGIADKADYHLADSLRYVSAGLYKPAGSLDASGITVQPAHKTFVGSMPAGVFNS